MRNIWRLSDCNGIRTYIHLVRKRKLNRIIKCTVQISTQKIAQSFKASLAKWLSVRLRTKWFWIRVRLQSRKLNHLNHLLKLAVNGWVFVYKLSGCGFESRCSHFIYLFVFYLFCLSVCFFVVVFFIYLLIFLLFLRSLFFFLSIRLSFSFIFLIYFFNYLLIDWLIDWLIVYFI